MAGSRRHGLRQSALCRGLGRAGGHLPVRQAKHFLASEPLSEKRGDVGSPFCAPRLHALPVSGTVYPRQSRASDYWVTNPRTTRSPSSRSEATNHRTIPGAVRGAGRYRKRPWTSDPAVWVTPFALYRHGQNPFTVSHHGRSREPGPTRRLVEWHSPSAHPLFAVCRPQTIYPGRLSALRIRQQCQQSCHPPPFEISRYFNLASENSCFPTEVMSRYSSGL